MASKKSNADLQAFGTLHKSVEVKAQLHYQLAAVSFRGHVDDPDNDPWQKVVVSPLRPADDVGQ